MFVTSNAEYSNLAACCFPFLCFGVEERNDNVYGLHVSEYVGNCLSVTGSLLVSEFTGVLRSLVSCVVVSVSLDGAFEASKLKAPVIES